MRHKEEKPPRWFREQAHSKTSRQKKYFSKVIIALLIILFFFLGYFIYLEINKSLWDGKNDFNLSLWDSENIYAVAFHKNPPEINVLQIPSDTYLALAKGFGEYPAGSIWSLGELEKFGGGELLKLSCQNFLGVPVQGWGKVNKTQKKLNSGKSGAKINKNDLLAIIGKLAFNRNRNLAQWDLLRLWYFTYQMPSSQFNVYDLSETRAGEEITLPDGSKAFKVQKEFMDNLVKSLFNNENLGEEAIITALLNQSDYSGLAGYAARIINNIGGETAAFYDDKRGLKEGIYCWQEETCGSYTLKLYGQTFNLPIIKENVNESRAESLIVMGNDFGDYFFKR